MEQLVLVSVFNKNLKTQSVKKQEHPKYQPSQDPRYQIDSLDKEINNFFFKADFLVDKTFSYPRIKLSNSRTLILDSLKTGLFLSDFAQQLRL